MPFTAGHPSAVVLLARRPAVTSALVVGSVAPDIPYYLPVPVDGSATHSALGTFVYDVPGAFALFVVFHTLLKWPMLGLAPARWQPRLVGPAAAFSWRAAPWVAPAVAVSLTVGAATHVFWDAFTHVDGGAVQAWPVLETVVLGVVPAYRLLQYASSVVGITVVVWWVRRGLRRTPPRSVPPRLRLSGRTRRAAVTGVAASAAVGAAVGLAAWAPGDLAGYDLVRGVVVQALFGAGAGIAAALVCYAAVWHWAGRRS